MNFILYVIFFVRKIMFLFMIDWNDFFENDFSPKLIYVVRGIKGVWDASCFLYFEPRTKRKKSNFICST